MDQLLSQLGINGKLLLAQAVNFVVLLTVLTLFVYRPLMKIMEERRKKIEHGIQGAKIADQKIAEAEQESKVKLAAADKEAVSIIGQAEKKAGERTTEIIDSAHQRSEAILREAEQIAARKKEEELEKLSAEAGSLIREAIVKAVELNPAAIDEKMIDQAAALIKQKI